MKNENARKRGTFLKLTKWKGIVPKFSSDNGAIPTTLLQNRGKFTHTLPIEKGALKKYHLKSVLYQKVLGGRLCVVLPSMAGVFMWSAPPCVGNVA